MARRSSPAITVTLQPTRHEERTRLTLQCTLPTALPHSALHQLLSLLAFWSGPTLHVVIAAGGPVGWSELWFDAVASVPGHHLTVECAGDYDA
jgi:hypothetical protein